MFGRLLLVLMLFAWQSGISKLPGSGNTIEGRVTTPENYPLENVRVFLLDGGYGQRGMVYTDSSGRYRFTNVSSGNYYVQIEPRGSGDKQQTQRVQVNPIRQQRGLGEIFHVDFVLTPKKPMNGESPSAGAGIVFYQAVPDAARKEFQRGMKDLKNNNFQKATTSFKRAIDIFPDYYEALGELGIQYVKRHEYSSAAPLLTHALKINPKGEQEFYALGIALCELNQRKDGIKALRTAVELNPLSTNARLRLGIELGKDEPTRTEAILLLKDVAQVAGKQVPEVYFYLADSYEKNKQYSESADALESYLQTVSRTAQPADKIEKIKKAIELLRKKAVDSQTSP